MLNLLGNPVFRNFFGLVDMDTKKEPLKIPKLPPIWKPIGVYRTFPLPMLPLLAPMPRKAWTRPKAEQGAVQSTSQQEPTPHSPQVCTDSYPIDQEVCKTQESPES